MSKYKTLVKLRLSNNLINTIEEIQPLKSLEDLMILDLVDCPITEIKDYRELVFKTLPQIQVLDETFKNGEMYVSGEGIVYINIITDEDCEGEEFEDVDEEDFIDDDQNEEDIEEESGEEIKKNGKKKEN